MPRSLKAVADVYPQLEALFCGYLHQDYSAEHGDLAGAIRAFRRDARAAERLAVKKEWAAFQAASAGKTLTSIRETLTRGLGGSWAPRKRADLDLLDTLIARL